MTATVLVVIGTRPEAIKLAPVVRALQADAAFRCVVCVTGQHRDLVAPVLELFGIRADIDLGVMRPGQSLSDLTAAVLSAIDPHLERLRPEWVVVQGDTVSALAAAMAAHFRRIPVAHVEAGLRTGDRWAPFPEEVSRRMIADLASLHFAPTPRARAALLAEGMDPADILVTGNPVVDAMLHARALPFDPTSLSPLPTNPLPNRLGLVTAHRRENHGDGIAILCAAILPLLQAVPGLHVVWPVHPHPDVDGPVRAALAGVERVHLLPPIDYRAFLWLLERANFVVTDSGGVQEEAAAYGRSVVLVRETTERPEIVEAGLAALVGPSVTGIYRAMLAAYRANPDPLAANPFGDGHAAGRIVAGLRAAGASGPGIPRLACPPISQRQPNPIFVHDRFSVLVCGDDQPIPPASLAVGALRPTLMLRPGAAAPAGDGGPERAEFTLWEWRGVAYPDVAPGVRTIAEAIEPYADAILREAIRQRARLIVAIGHPAVAYPAAVAARWAGIPFALLDGFGWQVELRDGEFRQAERLLEEARAAADVVVAAGDPVSLDELAARASDAFAASERALPPPSSMRAMTIAIISDEFTGEVFAPEATFLPITPASWPDVFDRHAVDALVVESTWKGMQNSWQGHVYRAIGKRGPLDDVIAHCRNHGIPTIYWGKEDPPYRSGFLGSAVEADVVFTSDAGSLRAYRDLSELRARSIVSLTFAAQPKLHHPLSAAAVTDPAVAFGGTWWSKVYPERARIQQEMFEAVAPFGLAIYDRSQHGGASGRPYPEQFASFQRGGLPYHQMVEAYRRHPIHLNVNIVTASPTMFSRRVFEVLACGSVVISGPGRGVTELLGDVVPVLANPQDAAPIVARWIADPVSRLEDARRGWREVYRAHLAGHRLALMLRVAGMRVAAPALPAFALHVDRVGPRVAAALLGQTILPAAVVTADPVATAALPGVRVLVPGAGLPSEVAWVGWLDEASAAELAAEHYEDLLLTRAFDDADAVGMIDPEPGMPVRLVEADAAVDPFGGLLRRDLADPAGVPPAVSRFGLGMRRPVGAR